MPKNKRPTMPKEHLEAISELLNRFQDKLETNLVLLAIKNTEKVRRTSVIGCRDWVLKMMFFAYELGEEASDARNKKKK